MASLLVYEKVHNTSVEKESALAEYLESTSETKPSLLVLKKNVVNNRKALGSNDRSEFGIKPYPDLPEFKATVSTADSKEEMK